MKTPTIEYKDLRLTYSTNKLLRAERTLETLKKSVNFGAGLILMERDAYDLIEELKFEMMCIISQYSESGDDVIINNNPLSEAAYILSKMYCDKGYEEEAENYKKLATTWDPNNESYK
jgi:hypothetical protein